MDSKSWYLSKTVWAAFVAIISQMLMLLGVFAPDTNAAELQNQVSDPALVDQILNIVTIVASAVAVLGRAISKTVLTK